MINPKNLSGQMVHFPTTPRTLEISSPGLKKRLNVSTQRIVHQIFRILGLDISTTQFHVMTHGWLASDLTLNHTPEQLVNLMNNFNPVLTTSTTPAGKFPHIECKEKISFLRESPTIWTIYVPYKFME